ncbi:MAG: hypothetical protein OXF26_08955 [Alphaproteobacteria bacterium]|nr:hypothetical protein [Rhodospirillaceae bacterium]MCY4230983.1 hypothetical protein [Alphaproteobacteria bacterium]
MEDGSFLALDGSRFARFAEAFLDAQGLLGFHRAEACRFSVLAEALEGCGAPWTGGGNRGSPEIARRSVGHGGARGAARRTASLSAHGLGLVAGAFGNG